MNKFNTWAIYVNKCGLEVNIIKVTDRSIVFNFNGGDVRRMSHDEFMSHHREAGS